MRKYLWVGGTGFVLGLLAAGFILIQPSLKNDAPAITNSLKQGTTSLTPLYASSPAETFTPLDFSRVAEKVAPAVVKIECERVERVQGSFEEWPFDEFWDRFFGIPRNQPREYRTPVQGTGFLISSDGYILTNNHVVEKAAKITVFTSQGDELAAKPVGFDPRTDLALIKVEGKEFPYAELGDSSQIKVGEWVLAIGNPWGLEHTVTAGIISAKGRQFGGDTLPVYQDFIQTDAAINRGNSGGPLVNLKGEVIGITSNIFSPTGSYAGIGFAIPSSLARKVVAQLKEKGRVVRGYLGIIPRAVDEELRQSLKLKTKEGAVVQSVEPNTPADKAGLKQYDVIIEVNGQKVKDDMDLRFKIAEIRPGSKATFKIIRDGKEQTLTAEIEELPEEAAPSPEGGEEDLGLTVTTLTPRIARSYGYRTQEGVLVTRVERFSEAQKKGIQAGDIILEVNRTRVTSTREFQNALRRLKSGEPIILLVRREADGRSNDFIVTLRKP